MLDTAKDGGSTAPLGSFPCLTILTMNKFFLKSNYSFRFLSMGAFPHILPFCTSSEKSVYILNQRKSYPGLPPTTPWRRDE